MKIQARRVNTKRHTLGYKIAGKWHTRAQAVRLAKQGKIDGVTVRTGGSDEQFIAALPGSKVRLEDLPQRVV